VIRVRVDSRRNPNFPQDAEAIFARCVDLVLGSLQREAKIAAPTFQGTLRNSIHIFRDAPLPQFSGGIISTVPWAITMEEGVSPLRIPAPTGSGTSARIPAIARWAQLKLGEPAGTAVSAAFAIIWGMHRKGIKARRFFQKALNTTEKRLNRIIDRCGAEIVAAWEKGG